MTTDNLWLPSSGCFQCPFEILLPKKWSTVNPLPGFAKPGGGYFSVPLQTWYLPIQFGVILGPYAVGEINNEHFELFMAIGSHELVGHLTLGLTHRKHLLRFAASEAHYHLVQVMENRKHEAFDEVLFWNSAIEKMTNSMALIEELYATHLGINALRTQSSIMPGHVDDIEDAFVEAHCDSKHFGPTFGELYGRLSNLYRAFGPQPLHLAFEFAVGYIDVEDIDDRRCLSWWNLTAYESEQRLRRAFEMLERLENARYAYQKFDSSDWTNFFEKNLSGYKAYLAEHDTITEILEAAARTSLSGSPNIDSEASAAEALAKRIQGVRARETDWDPFDTMILSEGNNISMNVSAPNSPPFLSISCNPATFKALPEEAQKDIAKQHLQKFFDAQANNRTLVTIYNENPDSIVGGYCLVPAGVEGLDTVIPWPMFAADWELESKEDGARLKEWVNRRELAMLTVYRLLFFEGCRLQIAAGCGVRCPMRPNGPGPCCGAEQRLRELFAAGQEAVEQGWPVTNWEMPLECQQSSAATV